MTSPAPATRARVVAVHRSPAHTFHKRAVPVIRLVAGLGVEGDAHNGVTVKHLSRVAKDPTQPNLRQVHLVHQELHQGLLARGFRVAPGEMGENITTTGLDLLGLPRGARLTVGEAIIEITGLRNPCLQLDAFPAGLMQACLDRDEVGGLIRLAGVMGIVVTGGEIRPGDPIEVELPAEPHRRLEPV
ncbi:MAG: MOSC domain-containing protein [Dehalococcoidia bacterium]